MTYAKDNKIIQLPNRMKYASLETLAKDDIYPVVYPKIPEGKMLGEMYFDEENKEYTYTLVEAVAPEPYDVFDIAKAKLDLLRKFEIKIATYPDFRSQAAIIMECLTAKGFNDLNKYSIYMAQMGAYGIIDGFTSDEYEQFLAVFTDQNIDLTTYTESL